MMDNENQNSNDKLFNYKSELAKVNSINESFTQKTETIEALCDELMETNNNLRELQEKNIKTVEFFVETTLEEQRQVKEALSYNAGNKVVKWKYDRILSDLDKYCNAEQLLLDDKLAKYKQALKLDEEIENNFKELSHVQQEKHELNVDVTMLKRRLFND